MIQATRAPVAAGPDSKLPDAPKESTPEIPITVVIVAYSSSGTIGDALASLAAAHEEGLARVVVVDNASPDGTADRVALDHPWVELVRSPENLGYGRGCNLGFERVRSPFVLFMNADVVIAPADLRELLRFQRGGDRIGMTAPATRFPWTDLFQPVGNALTPRSLVAEASGIPGLSPKKRALRSGEASFKTDWLCGAIMLVRSDAFRAVGGFDPRFFLYFEETDICRRLHAAGWELWAVGSATATHLAGASARKVQKGLGLGDCLSDHYFRSRYYYLDKHFGRLAAAASETGELVAMGSRDLLRAVLNRPAKHELKSRLKAPVFSRPAKQSGALKITVLPATDLTESHWRRWGEIQKDNPELDSPYFRPEFARIVGSLRPDAFVAVLGSLADPRGFFPFQRRRFGFGSPLGSRLSDFHGVIATRDATFDAPELMRACRLSSWDFHALPASQAAFAPLADRTLESHFIDARRGLEGYEEALRRLSSSQAQRLRSWRRKAEKEFKKIEFVPHVTDLRVLETLLEWKSRQYRETGTVDNWSIGWMRDLVLRIHAQQGDEFAGQLSALYFDGELAAVHMGMRSRDAWHWWFPRFDDRFEDFRPGLLLLSRIVEHAPQLGVKRIDLGYGDEVYKLRFRTGAIPMAEGRVEMASIPMAVRRWREGLESWVRRSPLLSLARAPGRLFKRLETWNRYR